MVKLMHKKSSEQGNVIIEFALVLWIIVLISMAGLEITRAIGRRQIATVLSREVANAVYRKCSVIPPQSSFQSCLNVEPAGARMTDFRSFAVGLVPGTRISVRIWSVNPATGLPREEYADLIPTPVPLDIKNSFSATGSSSEFKALVAQHDLVVAAEVFVPFRPIFLNFGGNLFNLRNGNFYDVTVL